MHIIWDEVDSRLTGRFVFLNDGPVPLQTTVLFPVGGTDKASTPQRTEAIRFIANGESLPPEGPVNFEPTYRRWKSWQWFQANYNFPLGESVWSVEAPLLTSGSKFPFARKLHYCLQSGAGWKGNIGHERVVIQLPRPPAKEQILHASPANFQIEERNLIWDFTDFEPATEAYDVTLELIHPRIIEFLFNLRSAYLSDRSVENGLRLATHLAVLNYTKGFTGALPMNMSEVQFQELAARLPNENQRQALAGYYALDESGTNRSLLVEVFTTEGRKLLRLLADVDFVPRSSYPEFTQEAEIVFRDLIRRAPRDAQVWRTYLDFYFLLHFAAVGGLDDYDVLSTNQQNLIRTALKNCPADPQVARWGELLGPNLLDREHEDIESRIEAGRHYTFEFPDIPNVYW